jgi:hypothetical protein
MNTQPTFPDDPAICDGCEAEVPFSELENLYSGLYCEVCAPVMRQCLRDERGQPHRGHNGYSTI